MSLAIGRIAHDTVSRPFSDESEPRGESVALVRQAKAGDRHAYERLYHQYARMIHAALLAHMATSEVDDLHQEVFLTAWDRIADLRQEDHFGAWLLGIARHMTHRVHRRARWRPGRLNTEVVDRRERSTDGEEILALLRELPEAYRETLSMRLVEGLSGAEIAQLSGLTPGSVRVNLSRGMKLLRERLQQEGWS